MNDRIHGIDDSGVQRALNALQGGAAARDATFIETLQQRMQAAGVHSLLVQFTDLFGAPKGKLVPLAHLADVMDSGAGFAGPSIRGTGLPRHGPRSEYFARGDANTLLPLPWMPGVARIVGDGFVAGLPFEACPRQVLKRAVERLAERGWQIQLGIEPEFFLLKRSDSGDWQPADPGDRLAKPSYDLVALARQTTFLNGLHHALAACGLDVLQLDHEDANGQYEVNFAHAPALASCDRLMLFKLASQALAEREGIVMSWMPKPFADQPGSGMHFHVSLWSGQRCLFDSADGHSPLSPLGEHFVAGVLAHSPGLCALAAPTVNSYKRLRVSDTLSGTSWAPAFVAHGPNNRTALVRTLPGRFEWRLPDSATNPYLAAAALIAAGLDGVDQALPLPPACHDDLFEMPLSAVRARGIDVLPQSLPLALDALRADPVLCAAMGPALVDEFVRLKRDEWARFDAHVSRWELDQYAAGI